MKPQWQDIKVVFSRGGKKHIAEVFVEGIEIKHLVSAEYKVEAGELPRLKLELVGPMEVVTE